jgi:hypothetical protein
MHGPALRIAYRGVVLLLWVLALSNSYLCRVLFWDGAYFVVDMLGSGGFHDWYPPREHIAWLTEWPVLLLVKAGVRDSRLLAMVFSAAMFAVPTAFYHLALARAREDAVLLAGVMAIVAVVYLPTCFFIIGEYNIVYAATTAAMAVVLTGRGRARSDGAILCAIGALLIASYEATIYLGPFLAAAAVWWRRRQSGDDIARLLGFVATAAFLGSMAVGAAALVRYWDTEYVVSARGETFGFWQNLQSIVPMAGGAIFVVLCLVWPRWLKGRGPALLICATALVLAATPLYRQLNPEATLSPAAQHTARSASGGLLCAILAVLWLHVAWRTSPPRFLALAREPGVGRHLVVSAALLVVAAALPDMTLSRLWQGYLEDFRGMVVSRTGMVWASDLPLQRWPDPLFNQDWSYPALSAIVKSASGQGVVVEKQTFRRFSPFDPRCGTLPRLEAYRWGE